MKIPFLMEELDFFENLKIEKMRSYSKEVVEVEADIVFTMYCDIICKCPIERFEVLLPKVCLLSLRFW